ncbi:hypothetical protein [Cerasicoccus arenae]|uniref:Uncharacterized protein n=1 Tax=Cerasicoccus arenae TaxID=424488 RepID=A0A8J3GEC4_9BACT|nr:hypothetical protein [Cerasicoccus arenae]MBK1858918.1 hypothetical protein [Cerasicoccus arenae]GHC08187.1 hypothetical protein GCM10007047_26780 [Cerasicoccus arenae]
MKYLLGFGLIGVGLYLTQSSFEKSTDGGGVLFYGLIFVGAITVIKEWIS